MKRVWVALVATMLMTPAVAEDAASAESSTALLKMLGITETREITQSLCRMTAVSDQASVLEAVPLLQKFNVLTDDKTANELRHSPTRTSMAITLQMAPTEIKSLYGTEKLADKCTFVHNLRSHDEYGNDRTELLFSYSFDRNTFQKINWDNFETQNLMKVSKNFRFGPETSRRMNSE